MKPLEILVGLAVASLLVVTSHSMRHTRRWLESHKIDYSFYEAKMREKKDYSIMGFVSYYLGFPGRKLASLFYSTNK